MDKYFILKSVFGHNSFREFQEEAIDAILNRRDLLLILPTGGGKSICYQLPSLMMDGVSVVISPLIALMQDQVYALKDQGVNAAMISSAQSTDEISEVFSKLKSKKLKLLYIAPERLVSEGFLSLLQSIDINFFVIDEAHCVSEWGHEFRSEYRKLGKLKALFPDTPIAAFTATATRKVAKDIENLLCLKNPLLLRGKTKRDNLSITVQKRVSAGKKQLINFLSNFKNECGIVYTFSRREAENVAIFLQSRGFKAKAYHAGLPNKIRDEVYRDFLYEKIDIVVATIAFGMGIDKSNIRFVVHTSLPKTMENFYQEIGRAGRDGLDSQTLLLYSKGDEIKRREFLDEIEDGEYKQALLKKQEQMYRFALSSDCRHKMIASYFGDDIDECGDKCDNCKKERVDIDITIEAQKFLSALYRCGQNFGQNYIIDILRGSGAKKILQNGHDKLSVYGIGTDLSKVQWEAIVDRLFEVEAISRGEFRALKIEKNGFDILHKRLKIEIDEEAIKGSDTFVSKEQNSEDREIFEQFRKLRSEIAKEEGVPAYIVFSDKTLKEMIDVLPQSADEMLSINGVGNLKYEKYGEKFLSLSNSFKQTRENRPAKLSDTHYKTLELILEGDLTLGEIAKRRQFQPSSVLSHIDLLFKHQKIDSDTKEKYFKEADNLIPKNIKKWYNDGLKIADISNLRVYFNILGVLNR